MSPYSQLIVFIEKSQEHEAGTACPDENPCTYIRCKVFYFYFFLLLIDIFYTFFSSTYSFAKIVSEPKNGRICSICSLVLRGFIMKDFCVYGLVIRESKILRAVVTSRCGKHLLGHVRTCDVIAPMPEGNCSCLFAFCRRC